MIKTDSLKSEAFFKYYTTGREYYNIKLTNEGQISVSRYITQLIETKTVQSISENSLHHILIYFNENGNLPNYGVTICRWYY